MSVGCLSTRAYEENPLGLFFDQYLGDVRISEIDGSSGESGGITL